MDRSSPIPLRLFVVAISVVSPSPEEIVSSPSPSQTPLLCLPQFLPHNGGDLFSLTATTVYRLQPLLSWKHLSSRSVKASRNKAN
ncbi:hypothetical protein Acr_15g0000990 [Actinidia rufa]|uniref:Uncharacterized protein n=1 Tax=Actinidia rufa TaxID=165716 RepID=A0A7J0FTK4_9ERIC|nr:hypothetical protein Acr_15g0000990 [Actinidia rufa]